MSSALIFWLQPLLMTANGETTPSVQGARPRVGVAQLSAESNSFVDFVCEMETFHETGYVYEGEELHRLIGTDTEVAGMLATLRHQGLEAVPLFAARAVSSAPLSDSCYRTLKQRLLALLEAMLPLDAVLLSHHGSMLAVGESDPEGDIIAEVRRRVGASVPIVVTLDMHANITKRMVEHANGLIGYRSYPHRDAAETGTRAAMLAKAAVEGKRLTMASVALPMLLTGFNASTEGSGPFARLMRHAIALERPPLLAVSPFLVGSYIDVDEIGCSTVVVAADDPDRARESAESLASAFWADRGEYLVDTVSVREAIRRGKEIAGGPILLLDTADTTGGGAAGDSIHVVRELIHADVEEPSLGMVVDPLAAGVCAGAGVGSTLTVRVGHAVDRRWGESIQVRGKVEAISEGAFRYEGGILGGAEVSMGPSAVLAVGALKLLIMTRATYEWADEQYRAVGLYPSSAKFVCVKNMMNYRCGYGNVMKAAFVVNCPGPTPPDIRTLPFQHVRRPMFPFDRDFDRDSFS